jgi:hypothetical protein
MAASFTSLLERYMIDNMPGAVSRINNFVSKRIPGEFLEVRAFPESLFNLRPEENKLPDGSTERMPFPRIADDQWISPNHTSFVLYDNGATIYPFKQNGTMLGQAIDTHVRSTSVDTEKESIGAILLKPDAIAGHQTGLIRRKIQEYIEAKKGRILSEREFNGMTADQVATITREPSSGGIGSRLKSESEIFTKTISAKKVSTGRLSPSIPPARISTAKITARKKFVIIPASAITMRGNLPDFTLRKFTGTGFAAANGKGNLNKIRSAGKSTDENQSRCLIGLSVSRPA